MYNKKLLHAGDDAAGVLLYRIRTLPGKDNPKFLTKFSSYSQYKQHVG